jgi:hypothetical protein
MCFDCLTDGTPHPQRGIPFDCKPPDPHGFSQGKHHQNGDIPEIGYAIPYAYPLVM